MNKKLMQKLKEEIENSSIEFSDAYLIGNELTLFKIYSDKSEIFKIKLEGETFFATKSYCTKNIEAAIEATDSFDNVKQVLGFIA